MHNYAHECVCKYMYVRTYVCVYMCMLCVCVCVHMRVLVHACVRACDQSIEEVGRPKLGVAYVYNILCAS